MTQNPLILFLAYKKGLFVIKPSGDTVTIINDDNFQPMTWVNKKNFMVTMEVVKEAKRFYHKRLTS
ncbi:hypothetical protein CWATWH0401_291 [Crocosphaera watsonii WH 0401]|uniref:Uncharacterized protein n=1 Tax=Crocosphaera watsonii WH 0401 TaxID=555881 RepID=T2J3Y0_CROWT|nr:hypothetical protein CWATWH0401_291 [Crocosphaera watsonii WH 0401]